MVVIANDALVLAGVAVMCTLIRLATGLITSFSDRVEPKRENEDAADTTTNITPYGKILCFIKYYLRFCYPSTTAENQRGDESPLIQSKTSATSQVGTAAYGTVYGVNDAQGSSSNPDDVDIEIQDSNGGDESKPKSRLEASIPYASLGIQLILFTYFLSTLVLTAGITQSAYPAYRKVVYGTTPLGCVTGVLSISILLNLIDFHRKRFGSFQRIMYMSTAVIFLFGCSLSHFVSWADISIPPTKVDMATLLMLTIYTILAITECRVCQYPDRSSTEEGKKAKLTTRALFKILHPYFWPKGTTTRATLNRVRVVATWLCVVLSKCCSIISPLLIGKASTALTRYEYGSAIHFSVLFAIARLGAYVFKEGQGLLYLFVGQAAFVELSEVTFSHLHSLSLDWHLQKKLGQTIRSMDRGIGACDSLMRYLFLFLLPAFAEFFVVIFIFASYFNYLPLAIAIFAFVYVYALLTIILTLWRKKFRKQVTESDNKYHDVCTDSLLNFETVKYFTAEDFEIRRFVQSIERYQSGSVNVKASLSYLNISQQVLLQACLATCLALAAMSIRDRINCCISVVGCDEGNSECCSSSQVCSGLEMGDFIAVLTYAINLFAPLNYLGSIYNSIVMSLVDLANLSELLAESPDVSDDPDAIELPLFNDVDDTVVEFEDVRFHYPTQPDTKGLKGLSFKMKRGTVTALVGPTGEGKTTVSRLLFRFYDVLGGAVKINGIDSRLLLQKSLRGAIGVVPQNTSLFNDSLKNNIKYGRQDATDEEILQVIEDAQLKTFIESLPKGWDTTVGDRGLKLSGGEQQRTAIARCLLKNPSIVVLDEATSALDTLTENSIQDALDQLGNDRTVLVVAHRLGTIRHADNIIVLNGGIVAEEGTHDELLALGGRYAEMWNMQLHSTK